MRRFPRYKVECMAVYETAHGLQRSQIDNMSLGGCFILTPRPLSVGTTFIMALDGPEGQLNLGASVRWACSSGMGVSFDESNKKVSEGINTLIAEVEVAPYSEGPRH